MDHRALELKIEKMQRAAEKALQEDAAFFEALHALKSEIDRDPHVQRATSQLKTIGRNVFSSFVPRVKIRVRTSEGDVSLPHSGELGRQSYDEKIAGLVQELRHAASAVILRSRCRVEIDNIVNEAVSACASFEGVASEIESAGHELLICLDLSAYTQLQEKTEPSRKRGRQVPKEVTGDLLSNLLSSGDVEFLKAMKIRAHEV